MTVSERGLDIWTTLEEARDGDSALIDRCRRGDEAAFSALYHQYAAYIYRLTYSYLQHKEDAEEVLQDTFEYAFRRIHRYDARKASFKTWIYQIAVSRCRNKRRRKWLPTFSLAHVRERDTEDREAVLPDEMLALNARQQEIWKALNELSSKLRETAVLRYYEGLSYPEIGEILGIPAKTAQSRMRLAHKALKELLSNQEQAGD
ncbi:MAG: RNA polymerase sigma factor [Chloroflexota bacterium]